MDAKLDSDATLRCSAAEWDARVNLAALYRLVALKDWDDLVFTHISCRVPGPERHFLINPFGLQFAEVTASCLVKIDLEGTPVEPTPYRVNYPGFVIHSAIHAARADAHYVLHLHTDDGVAVSSQAEGLLPLNQRALQVMRRLAYHDFEGVVTNLDEQRRIVADLGSKSLLILRNHGTLAIGETPGDVWMGIYALEKACTVQVRALSVGRQGVLYAPDAVREKMLASNGPPRTDTAELVWASLLRQARQDSPGFDA
jgi:ribulose-5-phosphate 4-epimerase/fuculose-1-phosphate aldolase